MPRNRLPLVVAGVAGLILVLVLRSMFAGGGGGDSDGSAAAPRGPREGCIGVNLTASSEKAGLLGTIAQDYANAGHSVGGKCVDILVTTKASGGAEEALARGWDDGIDGPRPDVWSPAASTWLGLLQEDLARTDKPSLLAEENPSIARTPLVLAMPEPMARALGWPDAEIGWADVLELAQAPNGWASKNHPEWGAFKLGKTNPMLSTSGLAATVGIFVAATGRSSDLTQANLADKDIRAFATAVEGSVVHYGDTTLTFLANLQRADDAGQGLGYVSAVAVEEKSVFDYNTGNPTGNPQTAGKHEPPKIPLAAVYPAEGTLASDNPYAVLDAPWVTAEKRAAAQDFLDYLLTEPAQERFTDAGFRDAKGKPGAALQETSGVLLDQPKVELSPPAPPVLAKVRQIWTEVRKRARVLLVIDVSGSMGEQVGSAGGQSKLELAKAAAADALADFAPDDQVGVWAFTSDLPGPTGVYAEIAPIASLGPNLDRVRQAIGNLTPLNGTPLYAVTRQAVSAMSTTADPDRINAVVLLTDGRNEYPPDTDLSGLIRAVQVSENSAGAVRVFSIAYGQDADLETLRQISEASRAAAYDATDPTSIERIFTAVISNF
ncbi:MAG TPA: substrate-binding and VWA domain-containing protein [Actinomycetes bacterium]|nr:substrate-binding and VWA domain-containing protein [Actinomycetes bacterium]